jgi:hypothetical protein
VARLQRIVQREAISSLAEWDYCRQVLPPS